MLVLAQVSSMKTRREGSMRLLVVAPARPMAAYVRAVLLARDERLFLSVTPIAAEEAAHHRRVGLDAALGQQAVAQRLQRDVGLLGPQPPPETPGAAPASSRRWPPILPARATPLRSKRSSHLIADRFADPEPSRRSPPAHPLRERPRRSPGRANPANKLQPSLLASAQPAG